MAIGIPFLSNINFLFTKVFFRFRSPKQNYQAISFTIGNWAENRLLVRFAFLNYVRLCLHRYGGRYIYRDSEEDGDGEIDRERQGSEMERD